MKKEFTSFFLVTLIGLGINVGIASFVVNFLGGRDVALFGSQLTLNASMIANLGGLAAAVIVAVWNFVGYKFIVFKK